MTNAEWMIKSGHKFKNIDIRQRPKDFFIYEVYIDNALIDTYRCTDEITYWDVIMNWLDTEHKESILDEPEREYLSAVIKPFRDHVRYICKGVYESGTLEKKFHFIKISIGNSPYDLIMPGFAPYTMYQGMELNKEYTLKELGL